MKVLNVKFVFLFQRLDPLNVPTLTAEQLTEKQRQADEKREAVSPISPQFAYLNNVQINRLYCTRILTWNYRINYMDQNRWVLHVFSMDKRYTLCCDNTIIKSSYFKIPQTVWPCNEFTSVWSMFPCNIVCFIMAYYFT